MLKIAILLMITYLSSNPVNKYIENQIDNFNFSKFNFVFLEKYMGETINNENIVYLDYEKHTPEDFNSKNIDYFEIISSKDLYNQINKIKNLNKRVLIIIKENDNIIKNIKDIKENLNKEEYNIFINKPNEAMRILQENVASPTKIKLHRVLIGSFSIGFLIITFYIFYAMSVMEVHKDSLVFSNLITTKKHN